MDDWWLSIRHPRPWHNVISSGSVEPRHLKQIHPFNHDKTTFIHQQLMARLWRRRRHWQDPFGSLHHCGHPLVLHRHFHRMLYRQLHRALSEASEMQEAIRGSKRVLSRSKAPACTMIIWTKHQPRLIRLDLAALVLRPNQPQPQPLASARLSTQVFFAAVAAELH
ncbi:hypothetical protein M408DRAFT_123826 [Serendipita vermifera MAFF 305830]|uniref:Uncharacterized protein n=1 Tax=Serendipita vermifera MAFF 305830 TaxID=933852 RepID=A0A0C3AL62_SERVB|nr:hypothetical protein M408DRAFT_123826 [Serendipita vermifera MAFF 305830]